MTELPDEVIAALACIAPGPHVVTIGNFDGVHRGHQYLAQLVTERARVAGARSLAVTFEPHPTQALRPDQPFERLTSAEEKLRLLRATGVDEVVALPFTRAFAALSPQAFLDAIVPATAPVAVYVGEGFRFGDRRVGDAAFLRAYAAERGFAAVIVPRIADGARPISSSAARAALRAGELGEAERVLGRRYRLRGTVEHGAARGRELGYPTANLELPASACVPLDGIYAAYAHVDAGAIGARQAMVYIGSRPVFDNGPRVVEVNILDFMGDLYTLDLEIEFVRFIRPDATFRSVDELVAQIGRDEEATRVVLERSHSEQDYRIIRRGG